MVNHFKLASSRMNLNFFAIRVKFSNNNLHEDKGGGWVGEDISNNLGVKGGLLVFFYYLLSLSLLLSSIS